MPTCAHHWVDAFPLPPQGVANRRKEAQGEGHKLAKKLKPGDFVAVQARERWSTSEDMHFRAGHFWLARVVDAGEDHFMGKGVVRKVTERRM